MATACSPSPAPSSTSLVVTHGSAVAPPADADTATPEPREGDVPDPGAAMAAFVRCMNEAGVTIDGVRVDATGHAVLTDMAKASDVATPQFRDALSRCGPGLVAAGLLSLAGDEDLSTVLIDELRQFTACMRREGVEAFPAPLPGFEGTGPAFDPAAVPFDDPELPDALDVCRAALLAG